jgi:Pheromone A receptor
MHRRLTFAIHLQESNSALTTPRYLRLIAMAMTEMFWGTLFTSYNLYNNVYPGVRPWTNWADVHSNFSRVGLFPEAVIPPPFASSMLFLWWAMPASSIIFFIFFGFGEETRKEYRKLWTLLKKIILTRKVEKSPTIIASVPSRYVFYGTMYDHSDDCLLQPPSAFSSYRSKEHQSGYETTKLSYYHLPTYRSIAHQSRRCR